MSAVIAEAMIATLEAASLSLPFTAVRAYTLPADLAELEELRLTVITGGLEVGGWDVKPRSSFTWTMDLWISQRVDNTPEEIDPLIALLEELSLLFHAQPLAGTEYRCVGLVAEAPAADKLDSQGLFLARVSPSFQASRG